MSTPSAIAERDLVFQLLSKIKLPAGDLAYVMATYLEENPPQPRELDSWRGALAKRGTSAQIRILEAAGPLLNSEKVARRMGHASRTSPNNLKIKGQLLAINFDTRRGDHFPEFQFDGGAVREWVPALLERIPEGWSALSFLTARRPELAGESFLTTILQDPSKASDMLAAADAYVS